MKWKLVILLSGFFLLGSWGVSEADARFCRPHHGYGYPRSGFSIGFGFGHPGFRGYHPYHYQSYRYYRPRTYAAPRRVVVQRSKPVAQAQRTLNEIGYHAGPVDGVFGPKTSAALSQFQSATGLPITGKLDSATSTRLAEFN
ncbi:MAG: peptidoglycan-binding domain-containing protein [Verrucomicrobiota bacterium]